MVQAIMQSLVGIGVIISPVVAALMYGEVNFFWAYATFGLFHLVNFLQLIRFSSSKLNYLTSKKNK